MRLLLGLDPKDTQPARTPWPILALRLAVGALIILAMAGPLWNGVAALAGSGPLLVLIDDGWPAAPSFEKRVEFARERLEAAARAGRTVAVKAMSQGGQDVAPLDMAEIEGRLRSLAPVPYAPDRDAALPAIEQFPRGSPKRRSYGSPTASNSARQAVLPRALAALTRSIEVVTDGGAAPRRRRSRQPGRGACCPRYALRFDRPGERDSCRALDGQGREVGRAPFDFGANLAAEARFELPVELRNDISRVVVDGERSAGATWLVDERSRRRRVAIASGASADVGATASRAELLPQARAAAFRRHQRMA